MHDYLTDMENDAYKTIAEPSTGIYKEKGSKFLAYAFPIYEEEQARKHVETLKKEYYDARHHCYAWQLGMSKEHFRVNDDGEPSGTAGKPILGQILSNELTNILIVVVRYFGGIKLGTSGLIAAYKAAAADAIANAQIVEETVKEYYEIHFNYEAMNDVMRIIKEEQPQIIRQVFDLRCTLELCQRKNHVGHLLQKLEAVTSVKSRHVKTA